MSRGNNLKYIFTTMLPIITLSTCQIDHPNDTHDDVEGMKTLNNG
jgi:hypothetical protein